MDKCPYCGAETRQGDNFCLNCGNRLLPATPTPPTQQAQPATGDSTLAEPEGWGAPANVMSPGGSGWEPGSPTIGTPSNEQPTVRESAATAHAVQATMDRPQEPARFILRSDSGDVLNEYPLDKVEIVIGRAPNSDILLSKDKLTSRRHATVHYEGGQYLLRDEHSANGTFINGQQLEEVAPHVLKDGDHVGIGEHELIFRSYGSAPANVEDLPTISVGGFEAEKPDATYRTHEDALATIPSVDDYATYAGEEDAQQPEPEQPEPEQHDQPVPEPVIPISNYAPVPTSMVTDNESVHETSEDEEQVEQSAPVAEAAPAIERTAYAAPTASALSSSSGTRDAEATFNRFSAISAPSLPDTNALMAALSALDGQVMSLQEQFKTAQEAMRQHDQEILQTASQLRSGIRRVSERMDGMIADVARSREALAWAELLQLMEDVMNNPRDIEYVTKLARKARELNKVFQIHQNVLNTMAECNSLLRSMIGEEK